MPDLRPLVTPEQVQTLLGAYFSTPIDNLGPEDGQIARIFTFSSAGQEYSIRFNYDNMLNANLPKEMYLLHKFAGSGIPIPSLLHVGRLDDLYFAIARKISGQPLSNLPQQEIHHFVPQILAMLAAIHNFDISDTQGYGVFGDQGTGLAPGWSDHLHLIMQEEADNDYFGKWYHLFDDTFLERDLYEDLYQRMCDLLVYCPTERYLLHGGMSLYNILAQDGKIIALQNWLDASYGDFVYDIAALDFWYPQLNIAKAFEADYQQRQRALPHYAERLLCYECYLALGALRFFAQSDQKQNYDITRLLIQHKLSTSVR